LRKEKEENMRTLNISISDIEFRKFGLKKEKLSFSDFLELISKEVAKRNLAESVEMAEKYGLSKMSMTEISKEVKVVRKNAKNHS
jgi:predicted CopG family antitoxin